MLLTTDVDNTIRSALATGTWVLGFGITVLPAMALLGELLRSLGRAPTLVRAVDLSTPLGLRRVAATIVATVATVTGSIAPALAATPPTTTSTISIRSWLNGEAAGDLGRGHDVAGLPVADPTEQAYSDIPSPTAPKPANVDAGGTGRSLPKSGLTYTPHTGPASAAPKASTEPAASGETYVVVPGDSLWRIASRLLGSDPSNRQTDAAWRRIYAANETAIGSDPGLIHPGLNLTLPPLD